LVQNIITFDDKEEEQYIETSQQKPEGRLKKLRNVEEDNEQKKIKEEEIRIQRKILKDQER
jgi:hypothetical protein